MTSEQKLREIHRYCFLADWLFQLRKEGPLYYANVVSCPTLSPLVKTYGARTAPEAITHVADRLGIR